MPGPVTWLPDAEGTVTDLPVFGSASPMREVTETVAFDAAWDSSRRKKVRELFDGMAADWSSRATPEREASILDALDRGGLAGGTVIELGSGTGLGTGHLIERFDDLIALDLSMQMLRHQPDLAPKGPGRRLDAALSRRCSRSPRPGQHVALPCRGRSGRAPGWWPAVDQHARARDPDPPEPRSGCRRSAGLMDCDSRSCRVGSLGCGAAGVSDILGR